MQNVCKSTFAAKFLKVLSTWTMGPPSYHSEQRTTISKTKNWTAQSPKQNFIRCIIFTVSTMRNIEPFYEQRDCRIFWPIMSLKAKGCTLAVQSVIRSSRTPKASVNIPVIFLQTRFTVVMMMKAPWAVNSSIFLVLVKKIKRFTEMLLFQIWMKCSCLVVLSNSQTTPKNPPSCTSPLGSSIGTCAPRIVRNIAVPNNHIISPQHWKQKHTNQQEKVPLHLGTGQW